MSGWMVVCADHESEIFSVPRRAFLRCDLAAFKCSGQAYGLDRSGWLGPWRLQPDGDDGAAAVAAGRGAGHHDGERKRVGAGGGAAHAAYARTDSSHRCSCCAGSDLSAGPHRGGVEDSATALWDVLLVWGVGRSRRDDEP